MREQQIEWGVRRTQGDVGSVMACLGEWHADEMVEAGVGDKVSRTVTRSAWSPNALPSSEFVVTRSNTVHRSKCGVVKRGINAIAWLPGDPKRADGSKWGLSACFQCLAGRLPAPSPVSSVPDTQKD